MKLHQIKFLLIGIKMMSRFPYEVHYNLGHLGCFLQDIIGLLAKSFSPPNHSSDYQIEPGVITLHLVQSTSSHVNGTEQKTSSYLRLNSAIEHFTL